MDIQNRKKEHVELTVNEDVFYKKTTGFEQFEFVHNALPELDFEDVDVTGELLGRTFSLPLFISSMTGGYSKAGLVNAQIAQFCESVNLPFGVGSQRAMLENPQETESFSIVRKFAPNAFIAANIGGAQLINPLEKVTFKQLTECIEANAIIVHLNPLQELMQPEGDRNFTGVLKGIEHLVRMSKLPIIVKETGAGISVSVARKLLDVGVKVIDTAGAGGTSWAKVENLRKRNKEPLSIFDDWGIPTAECVSQLQELKSDYDFELIASGGIRNTFDLAKAIALGADFSATAQPVIKLLVNEGLEELTTVFYKWRQEYRTILTLLGCGKTCELNCSHVKKRE